MRPHRSVRIVVDHPDGLVTKEPRFPKKHRQALEVGRPLRVVLVRCQVVSRRDLVRPVTVGILRSDLERGFPSITGPKGAYELPHWVNPRRSTPPALPMRPIQASSEGGVWNMGDLSGRATSTSHPQYADCTGIHSCKEDPEAVRFQYHTVWSRISKCRFAGNRRPRQQRQLQAG